MFQCDVWFFWMVVPPAEAPDCAGMTDCIDSILFESAEFFHPTRGIESAENYERGRFRRLKDLPI